MMEGTVDNVSDYKPASDGIVTTPFGVVNGVLIFTAFWNLIFMIDYGIKGGKFTGNTKGLDMYITCLIAVIMAFLRFTTDEVIFFAPIITGALDHCEVIIDISSGFGAVAVMATYLFLWMRQRVIYKKNPALKAVQGNCIYIWSWVTLGLLLVLAGALSAGYIISSSFTSSARGCVYKSAANRTSVTNAWDNVKKYALGFYMFFTQAALLSLFVYPLLRVRARRHFEFVKKNKRDKINQTIRLSIICAVIASVSDVATLLIVRFVPRGTPIFVSSTIYNISTEINILCIMSMFKKFRMVTAKLLCSCCQTRSDLSCPLRTLAGTEVKKGVEV